MFWGPTGGYDAWNNGVDPTDSNNSAYATSTYADSASAAAGALAASGASDSSNQPAGTVAGFRMKKGKAGFSDEYLLNGPGKGH